MQEEHTLKCLWYIYLPEEPRCMVQMLRDSIKKGFWVRSLTIAYEKNTMKRREFTWFFKQVP